MTLDKFVSKYLGKATEYDTTDGVKTVQCVDLIKLYLSSCFGIKKKPWCWGNARDWYENYNNLTDLKTVTFRIKNTATLVPMRGDICVWTESNQYGHIAIAVGSPTDNTTTFKTYDQNWGGKAMKIVTHKYTSEGFLGVLRPYRVVKKDVNIRYKASSSSSYMGEYKAGTKVKVLDVSADGKWYKTPDGWCNNNNGNFFYEIGEKI